MNYENENENKNEENQLDDTWIKEFEKTDKLYQDFYKDDLYYINLQFIYVNRSNEIEKIKQESFLFSSPNHISRDEILGILKNNTNTDNKKYSLLSILRYNITLEPANIKSFLKNQKNVHNSCSFSFSSSYLTTIKNIDSISFEKSISMFHDLNDLIFVFYEKSMELKNTNTNNVTKRIYLNSRIHKNTIKKRYKE